MLGLLKVAPSCDNSNHITYETWCSWHPHIKMFRKPLINDFNWMTHNIFLSLTDSLMCSCLRNAGADKIRRYINYLFHQKSFYPLFPPKMPTDLRLLHEYGTINKVPHVMVVPSEMKYYMRVSLTITAHTHCSNFWFMSIRFLGYQ